MTETVDQKKAIRTMVKYLKLKKKSEDNGDFVSAKVFNTKAIEAARLERDIRRKADHGEESSKEWILDWFNE